MPKKLIKRTGQHKIVDIVIDISGKVDKIVKLFSVQTQCCLVVVGILNIFNK